MVERNEGRNLWITIRNAVVVAGILSFPASTFTLIIYFNDQSHDIKDMSSDHARDFKEMGIKFQDLKTTLSTDIADIKNDNKTRITEEAVKESELNKYEKDMGDRVARIEAILTLIAPSPGASFGRAK